MEQHQMINPIWGWFPPPLPPVTPFASAPQQIINDNDIINVGSGSIGGNPSPVKVTDVTTPSYTALPSDYFLCVDTNITPVAITLPTGILGTVYIVKDCTGDASNHTITVSGTGQLVDGSNATINSSFGSIQLIFNGTEWSIV